MRKIVVLFDIDYTLFQTQIFKESDQRDFALYEEVLELLKDLSEIAILGVFSQGDTEFQRKKLLKTNISKFFDKKNVHITQNKEEDLSSTLSKYRKSRLILVDDKYETLKLAKNIFSEIITIWVNRGPYARNAVVKGFEPDYEVETLSAILKVARSKIPS